MGVKRVHLFVMLKYKMHVGRSLRSFYIVLRRVEMHQMTLSPTGDVHASDAYVEMM